MELKLRLGCYDPLSIGWKNLEFEREGIIVDEMGKILESPREKSKTFPTDTNDLEAIVVMRRQKSIVYEWRIYPIRNRTHLALWCVVEEIKAFQKAGFEIEVCTFERVPEGYHRIPNGPERLKTEPFERFHKIQQIVSLNSRR